MHFDPVCMCGILWLCACMFVSMHGAWLPWAPWNIQLVVFCVDVRNVLVTPADDFYARVLQRGARQQHGVTLRKMGPVCVESNL